MGGVAGRLALRLIVLCWGVGAVATPGRAFELFDGRLQLHGFYESQVRALSADYSEQWDLAQWYQVFNLEIEADLISDTWGPIDLLQAFVRVEARFDCVYSAGCGAFKGTKTFGNRSRTLPPRLSNAHTRIIPGETVLRDEGLRAPNRNPVPLDSVVGFSVIADENGIDGINNGPGPYVFPQTREGVVGTFDRALAGFAPGAEEGDNPSADDPFKYVFDFAHGFRFTQVETPGGRDGGKPITVLGPWLPGNAFRTNAVLADRVNPFDSSDQSGVEGNGGLQASPILYATVRNAVFNELNEEFVDRTFVPDLGSGETPPILDRFVLTDSELAEAIGQLTVAELAAVPGPSLPNGFVKGVDNGVVLLMLHQRDALDEQNAQLQSVDEFRNVGANFARGGGGLPFRTIPVDDPGNAGSDRDPTARGLFLPSAPLRRVMSRREIGSYDFNFGESERAWNRGASQQQTKELKEAYFDIELFDSKLWIRAGRQSIVWGKTELFRTTDQLNPQDLALASLPTLEEARIPLWALRGVYSFYEVGPLDDVRIEVALNLDEVQSDDFGACGEAFTVNLVCQLTFGGFAHSIAGVGVVGRERVRRFWESAKGLEGGLRLEFRWSRFSFALSDYWGYNDRPFLKRISTYERNVDPFSGRPRTIGARGPCAVAGPGAPLSFDGDCLHPGPSNRRVNDDGTPYSSLQASAENVIGLTANDVLRGDPDDPRLFLADPSDPADPLYDPRGDPECVAANFQSGALPAKCGRIFFDPTFTFHPNNALDSHHANQTIFAFICSSTVGFLPDRDPRSCAQAIFGSGAVVRSGVILSQAVSNLLAGNPIFNNTLTTDTDGDGPETKFLPLGLPIVQLNRSIEAQPGTPTNGAGVPFNPGDLENHSCVDPSDPSRFCGGGLGTNGDPIQPRSNVRPTLSIALAPAQEALLGCGPFWGTSCDRSGLDLLNAEASALFQGFAGIDGTEDSLDDLRARLSQRNQLWVEMGMPQHVVDVDVTNYRTDGYREELLATDGGGLMAPVEPAYQPGTLQWASTASVVTGRPVAGPVCTTNNFGGPEGYALDSPTLPGCGRKWRDVAGRDAHLADVTDFSGLNVLDFDNDGTPDQVEPSGGRYWNPFEDGDPDALGVGCFGDLAFRVVNGSCGSPPSSPWIRPIFLGSGVVANATGAVTTPGAGHPFTGQPFATEIAGVSWNFQMLAVAFSDDFESGLRAVGDVVDPNGSLENPSPGIAGIRRRRAEFEFAFSGEEIRASYSQPGGNQVAFADVPLWEDGVPTADGRTLGRDGRTEGNQHCSFIQPQFCSLIENLYNVAGLSRNTMRAGGNGYYGRRTFQWHGGGEALLSFDKRNVLGFAMDFAEDVTKSNWGVEFTWIANNPAQNNNDPTGITKTDEYNLTISVDRPTFINFLNANRTFFLNSQWFFQYRPDYQQGFTTNGPWNILGIVAIQTGYFSDRLLPAVTLVYDVQSVSGAVLPQIQYRFNEVFSATFGAAVFFGRTQQFDMPMNELAPPSNRQGRNAYTDPVDNGLALVNDRDELFIRLRYTF